MKLTLLSTSDVHGYFKADDFRRPNLTRNFGLTRATTMIQHYRAQAAADEVVITIENGDFVQGSPLTDYIARQAQTEGTLYQEMTEMIGFDARILGNHEFNYGRDYLTQLFKDDANLLNANIIDQQTQQPFLGQPYRIIERLGLKIGILGLTTKYIPYWENPKNIWGLEFLDPVTVAKYYLPILKAQVDILIMAYHGGFAEDLITGRPIELLTGENQGNQLLQLPGVDALITGHQHRQLAEVVQGVPTTQPGYRASHVGKISMMIDDCNQVLYPTARLIETADYQEQPELVHQLNPLYSATNQWLDQPVGQVGDNMRITSPFMARLHNHPYLELVNQVQRYFGGTQISATALFNDEVCGLPDEVTQRDIMTNYIYPNTLVVERLSGADIKAALEINAGYFNLDTQGNLIVNRDYLEPKVQHYNYDVWSGITYTFDFSQPVGARLVDAKYQGKPIEDAVNYEVAMNNYRATGSGGFSMFSTDKIVREVQKETPDLIGMYMRQHPMLQIAQPQNIKTRGVLKV